MKNLYSVCIISLLYVGCAEMKAFSSDPRCGKVKVGRQARIVNGDVAEVGQIPWIASIKLNDKHICGGSIVSNRFILSAGHCFVMSGLDNHDVENQPVIEAGSNPLLNKYTVTLGDYSQIVNEMHSVTYNIKRVIFHDKYRRTPLLNDIVLLELSDEIEWTDHIQPICLPGVDIQKTDSAIAAGWGRDINSSTTDENNNKLRFVRFTIYGNDHCNHIYDEKNLGIHLEKTQMCAGSLRFMGTSDDYAGSDTNDGDSGGPLLVQIEGREVLVGITSLSTPESIYPKSPGIYTRVFEYLDWINDNISQKSWSAPVL